MLYPYEQTTVPPWAFMNDPMFVLTGYLGSTLPTSAANMFVIGLRPPFGPVEEPARDGHALLVRDLVRQEEQRARRHDAERSLGEGVLDRGGHARRAGLVVDDDPRELVAVDASLRVLQRDAGIEPGRGLAELRGPLAGQRADHGDGDRRARRCRTGGATDRAGHADHGRRHEDGDPQRAQVLPPTSTHLPPLCSGNPAGPPAESSHACTHGTQKAVTRLRRMRAGMLAEVAPGRQRAVSYAPGWAVTGAAGSPRSTRSCRAGSTCPSGLGCVGRARTTR